MKVMKKFHLMTLVSFLSKAIKAGQITLLPSTKVKSEKLRTWAKLSQVISWEEEHNSAPKLLV